MTTAPQPPAASCAACGTPIDPTRAHLDSAMRAVCDPCHAKDQLDQIDVTSMEDQLAVQRARQRKLILRLAVIAVVLVIALAGAGR